MLTEVYLDGWRQHNPAEDINRNGWTSDDIAAVFELPGYYRYVKLAAWSPYSALNEPEVDAVASIRPLDSDNDSLPDALETGGFRDGFGNLYFTDPNDPDTDGDGLSDGEEAGVLTEIEGKKYFKINSKPTVVDSDGDDIDDLTENESLLEPLNSDTDYDGLSDGEEFGIGTNPLIKDTDGDGVGDYEEYLDPDYDPLVYEKRYGILEIAREVVLGAVLGEWGADDYDGIYYMAGWMLSGFIAVGDIRDIAASISRGDGLGTLLNALALIPGYGDAEKVATTISKFVAKHPHMISAVALFVIKHVDESIDFVRKAYGDAIVDGLKSKGLQDSHILRLVKNNVDLNILHTVFKFGDDVVYVTKERIEHVFNRHVNGIQKGKPGKITDFFPTGNEVRPGVITPKVMSEQDVETLIKESIQFGTREEIKGSIIYTWSPYAFGINKMKTIITKDGKLLTSYPMEGSNVIRVTD